MTTTADLRQCAKRLSVVITVDQLVGGTSDEHARKAVELLTWAADELDNLRQWIKEAGEQNNTCTFNVLREVCEGCGCKRKPPK